MRLAGVMEHLVALKGNGKTIKNGGPGKPPEDGEVNEMTLTSRHRIRNMPFTYRNCTARNAVKTSSKIWITLVSIIICVKCILE